MVGSEIDDHKKQPQKLPWECPFILTRTRKYHVTSLSFIIEVETIGNIILLYTYLWHKKSLLWMAVWLNKQREETSCWLYLPAYPIKLWHQIPGKKNVSLGNVVAWKSNQQRKLKEVLVSLTLFNLLICWLWLIFACYAPDRGGRVFHHEMLGWQPHPLTSKVLIQHGHFLALVFHTAKLFSTDLLEEILISAICGKKGIHWSSNGFLHEITS